jgi:site-specific DNA-methyltransferase (adenine-specific)
MLNLRRLKSDYTRRMTELTLNHGDCLEVMKTIPDSSIDLIICDLPYGCLGPEKAGGGVITERKDTGGAFSGCPWDIKIDLEAFWKQIKRIRKSDHSPTIHFCTTKFGNELINSNPDEFRYDLVWDKQRGVSFLLANKMPMRSHEMIYIFSKAGAYYNRVDIKGDFKEHKQYGKPSKDSTYGIINRKNPIIPPVGSITSHADRRCVLSVIQNATKPTSKRHPTEKAESLYRFLIERYCPVGGTVLDPTFGSGNSVFTAFAMGRSAIGIEKDDTFFEKANERLNALP